MKDNEAGYIRRWIIHRMIEELLFRKSVGSVSVTARTVIYACIQSNEHDTGLVNICSSFAVKFIRLSVCLSQAQEACGPLEIENALTMVRGLERDMQEAKASAAEGKLRPLPGETVSVSVHSMCSTCICLYTTSPTLNIPAASKCPACMQTHSVLFKKPPRTHLRKLVEKMPRVSRAGN